jgi:serine/threonine protein kinase
MERFTKVKNIGKGNMGTCALVRNNEDNRHYVIKQVDLAKLNKKERAQSLNEAKVLSVLRHPNVINYVDSFLARKTDHLCIVMEYADGGDLGIKIKNAHGVNFSEDQVLDYMIQTVLALIHIHSRHILHRDIKTANVFLTSDGLCKLGDFGIARALTNTADHASTFVGTPYYLSPELILEKPYDMMSDVWAFGVCLYETMALKHPFNAGDMKGLMQKILRVQYDPLPTVYSAELRGLVGRILVKEPSQRMRLQDILTKVPIVTERIRKWLAGGILPARYISALVRFKLLPGVEGNGPMPAPLLSSTPTNMNNNNNNNNNVNSSTNVPSSLPSIHKPINNNIQPMATAMTGRHDSNSFGPNSNSDNNFALPSLPGSSHSNQATGPFTARPPPSSSGLGNNMFGNNFVTASSTTAQQQHQQTPQIRMGLPPLGNLGNNNNNNNNNNGNTPQPLTARKPSFSFPAPPNLPRQQQNTGNNHIVMNNGQFGQQSQGVGLVRKPSGMVLMQNKIGGGGGAPQSTTTTFPAPPKLPGLPALPALGRPQPGSI